VEAPRPDGPLRGPLAWQRSVVIYDCSVPYDESPCEGNVPTLGATALANGPKVGHVGPWGGGIHMGRACGADPPLVAE
jgi:hypothetical protein